jgi:hypothetical protein
MPFYGESCDNTTCDGIIIQHLISVNLSVNLSLPSYKMTSSKDSSWTLY